MKKLLNYVRKDLLIPIKKQEEKKLEEIESMYRDLVIAIKNSNDEKALEILENIFSIDEKNYLALNGAGILYTRMYSKNNKNLYFRKADKYTNRLYRFTTIKIF